MTERPPPRCPRCDHALSAGQHRGLEVLLCSSCASMMLERRQMIPLLELASAEAIVDDDGELPLGAPPTPSDPIPCPRCGEAMDRHGYMGDPRIPVDSCDACHVLWLEPSTLEAMSLLYARTERRLSQHREQLADSGADRLVHATIRGRRIQRWLMRVFSS